MKYIITILVLPFVMVFGVLLFLSTLGVGDSYSDSMASLINNGFIILAFLISVISTIIFILLYEILKELRKLNETKKEKCEELEKALGVSNNEI